MLTIKDISNRLSVNEETVRRWIRSRYLEAQLVGRTYYVKEEVLEKFIKDREQDGIIPQKGPSFISSTHDKELLSNSNSVLSTFMNRRKFLHDASEDKKLLLLERILKMLELEYQKTQLDYEIAKMDLKEEISSLREKVR